MMSTQLEDAKEGSVYIPEIVFSDELASAMTPVTAVWSLRDNARNIVNARENIALTPATAMSIVLSGADLAYNPTTKTMRTLTITGTWDSTEYGNNLPIADEYWFNIVPLVGIADSE